MNQKAMARKLRDVLDQAPSTGEFLQAVVMAIESLYAEDDDECPDGFAALDAAVSAFEAVEDS